MAKKKQTKSDTVTKLLTGPMPWRNKTDKQIAAKVGCSVSYVGKIRKTLQDEFYGHIVRESPNTAGVDPNAWTRSGILNQAEQYVIKDRAADHGDMEDNFQRISDLWTAYLGFDLIITSKDVAVMMTLLKIARIKSNPQNSDNWIDGAGYLACGGEIATQQKHK